MTDLQLLTIGFSLVLAVSFLSCIIVKFDANLKNRVVNNIIKTNSAEYNKMLVESIVLNSK